jgi:hypothetical protein
MAAPAVYEMLHQHFLLPQLDLLTFSSSDKFDEFDSSSKLVIIKLALMYIYKPPFCFQENTGNPSPLASKYQGKARKQHAFYPA